MKMETIEGNKLIAEFMGLKTVKKLSPLSFEDVLFIKVYNDATKIWDNELPRYDSSWDWIMPVVEKIGKMYDKKECSEVYNIMPLSIFSSIETVWNHTIAFIQWYNTTKSQPNATK